MKYHKLIYIYYLIVTLYNEWKQEDPNFFVNNGGKRIDRLFIELKNNLDCSTTPLLLLKYFFDLTFVSKRKYKIMLLLIRLYKLGGNDRGRKRGGDDNDLLGSYFSVIPNSPPPFLSGYNPWPDIEPE